MNGGTRQGLSRWRPFFDLVASIIGFSLAVWLYWGWVGRSYFSPWPAEWFREIAVSAVTAWVAMAFAEDRWEDGVRLWIDRFFSAVGFNLMIQYGLDYLFGISPTPWPVAVGGSLFAIGCMSVFQRLLFPSMPAGPGGILLLGYGIVADALAGTLAGRIVGVLEGAPARVPSGLPLLGAPASLADAVATHRPVSILVDHPDCASAVSPRQLLALRYSGVPIEDGTALYEDILQRVCWQRLDPLDLVVSSRLRINRAALALQAVYTNLIGLGLLLLSLPLLLLGSILVSLSTLGPAFESIECLGFQRIPFYLLRFRTRRADGEISWAGKMLSRLHLVNLPQLLNVIRGEMALFGPPPVRREFAARLERLLPAYPQRFTIKPGILGWSQANLPQHSKSRPGVPGPVPDESLRLGYDLYYAKEESPSLDLDIFLRSLFGAPLPADDAPARRREAAGNS